MPDQRIAVPGATGALVGRIAHLLDDRDIGGRPRPRLRDVAGDRAVGEAWGARR